MADPIDTAAVRRIVASGPKPSYADTISRLCDEVDRLRTENAVLLDDLRRLGGDVGGTHARVLGDAWCQACGQAWPCPNAPGEDDRG